MLCKFGKRNEGLGLKLSKTLHGGHQKDGGIRQDEVDQGKDEAVKQKENCQTIILRVRLSRLVILPCDPA